MAPAAHRLFFALWPDALVRKQLVACGREALARTGGRLMRAETLHITLAFLGAVDPARRAEVDRCAAGVRPRRLSLVVDQLGFWMQDRALRTGIVWAGVSQVPPELDALVAELRDALSAAGTRFDRKPFVPHVTLVRDARSAPLPGIAPVPWQVDGFALMRSAVGERGSDYVTEGSWRDSGG